MLKINKFIIPLLFAIISVIFFSSCYWGDSVEPPSFQFIQGYVIGYNNYPVMSLLAKVNNQTSYTDRYGRFNFPKPNSIYDILLTHGNYSIIYKNIGLDETNITWPNTSDTGYVDYTIEVRAPSLQTPYKGKLYYNDSWGFSCVQNFDSSSYMTFHVPRGFNYFSGSVGFITYDVDNNNHITDFKYSAVKYVSLETSATIVTFDQNEIKPVNETLVNIVVNPPQGSTSLETKYILNFLNNDINQQTLETFTTNSFSVLLPYDSNFPHFSPYLMFNSDGINGHTQQIKQISGNAAFDLSSPPSVITPENYAVNVDGSTLFSFQKQHISEILKFTLIDSVTGQSYALCTAENAVKLYQLSSMINLAPNRTYAYTLEQLGENADNMDAFLRNRKFYESFSGTTPKRYFTTKP
jgi:hypothetical protein